MKKRRSPLLVALPLLFIIWAGLMLAGLYFNGLGYRRALENTLPAPTNVYFGA